MKGAKARAAILAHPAFESLRWEDDGCFGHDSNGRRKLGLWVELKDGWNWCGCSSIHEESYDAALEALGVVEEGPPY